MVLVPTLKVPSMSQHPVIGDWYPTINKPAGVVHWLNHSKDFENVDWVLILDADQIIRHPITPWNLRREKGKPVAARYGYLIGCDNKLAKMHTKHPDLCDKVGGFIFMHIEDLRKFALLWLSITEDVRNGREHWATNITGDIYGKGWISEMYSYSFGAAEVGLRHKIDDDVMIYPGYIPTPGVEPLLMHYGLPFKVEDWEQSPSEFIIPLEKYHKAVYNTQVTVGMRLRMVFETEKSSVRRYMGTITGVGDIDPARWPKSHWRSLKFPKLERLYVHGNHVAYIPEQLGSGSYQFALLQVLDLAANPIKDHASLEFLKKIGRLLKGRGWRNSSYVESRRGDPLKHV